MYKLKRPIAAALCCLCLLLSVQTVGAVTKISAQASGFQPFYTTLSSITLSMSYSGGKVNWSGYISGNSNVTEIEATYTLEKLVNNSYSFVDDWDDSANASYLSSSGSKTTPKGTYRLTVAVTAATSSGGTESVSKDLVKTFT